MQIYEQRTLGIPGMAQGVRGKAAGSESMQGAKHCLKSESITRLSYLHLRILHAVKDE